MIEKIKILPELLIKLNYDFDFENSLKSKCIESINYSIEKNHKVYLEHGDSVSTAVHSINGSPHTWEENKNFIKFLKSNLNQIFEEFELVKKSVKVSSSWINRHSKGGKTLEHIHSSIDLVVSCYLNCPENSGNLLVRDPLEYHRWCDSQDFYSDQPRKRHYPWINVPVKTNDVLIFPGWLVHKTEENTTDLDRYVMTFNLNYSSSLGTT